MARVVRLSPALTRSSSEAASRSVFPMAWNWRSLRSMYLRLCAIEAQWSESDWTTAQHEFQRAIELDPASSDAYGYYAWHLTPMGRFDEAFSAAEKGRKADPLGLLANFGPGSVLLFSIRGATQFTHFKEPSTSIRTTGSTTVFRLALWKRKRNVAKPFTTFQHGLVLEESTELWSGLGHAYASFGQTGRGA